MLAASLIHIGAGAPRACDALHEIPLVLRRKGVHHAYQCSSKGFGLLVGDGEVVRTELSGCQFRGHNAGVAT